MANVVINDIHLTDIAAAIREKNGSADTYKPSEMAAAIAAITTTPGGSDTGETDFEAYIGRQLSGEVELTCERVGNYGLAGFWNVTKFTVHGNVSGSNAFLGCNKLQEINITENTTIGSNSCYGLTKLATVNAPLATEIGDYAFYNCSALTNATFGDVSRVGEYAFGYCSKLTKVDLGTCNQVDNYVGYIGPVLKGAAFSSKSLNAIIIRSTYMPWCIDSYTPFPDQFKANYAGALEKGYIYVPAAMIEQYESYTGNISSSAPQYDHLSMLSYRAIEDYPDICG